MTIYSGMFSISSPLSADRDYYGDLTSVPNVFTRKWSVSTTPAFPARSLLSHLHKSLSSIQTL